MSDNKGMKIGYFIAGIAVIAFAMFFVISNSKLTAAAKGAKLVFTEEKHDFGKVPQGPPVEYNFSFQNKGSDKLVIEKVTTSCGCTGATVGSKTEYSKNEKGEIKVTFNTQGREGHQEKTLLVFSNDPNEPQKVLTITCDIDPTMQQ